MLFSPRVYNGVHGFHVVTPLVRENGSTILVDRGFISRDCISSANWLLETGEVEVLGMLRTSQPRNPFTPNNDPANGKWYWTDVNTMAEHAGGKEAGVQPVFIEQIFGEIQIHLLLFLFNSGTQRDMLERQTLDSTKAYQ